MSERSFTETSFRSYLAEGRLMGTRCGMCDTWQATPRPLCPACFSDDMRWEALSGRGELAAFTVVHIAPTAMIEAGYGRDKPYVTGIVRLAEGPAISGQIVGVDPAAAGQPEVGMSLQASFITRGEGDQARAFLAFEPIPVGHAA